MIVYFMTSFVLSLTKACMIWVSLLLSHILTYMAAKDLLKVVFVSDYQMVSSVVHLKGVTKKSFHQILREIA